MLDGGDDSEREVLLFHQVRDVEAGREGFAAAEQVGPRGGRRLGFAFEP